MKNKINYYRLQEGYTLTALSNITGLSVGYICHLEKGSRNNPSYNVMIKIAKALDKNITDIFLN